MHVLALNRLWIALGAVAGLGAVALAAWSAHAGPRVLDAPRLAALGAAERMLLAHAGALVATGVWARMRGGRLADAAAACFCAGVLLFPGAVVASVLGGVSLGPAAPVGGVLLMLGWALLLASALRRP